MDHLPYLVRYKPANAATTSVRPGLHGKFRTEEEARKKAQDCLRWFEEIEGKGVVRVGIVVDDKALALQQAEAREEDETDDTLVDSGSSETANLLVEALEEFHGVEERRGKELVKRYAKLVRKGLAGGITMKRIKDTARELVNAGDNEETEIDKLKAEIARLKGERECEDESEKSDDTTQTLVTSSK